MKPKLVLLSLLILAVFVILPSMISYARPMADATSYGGIFAGWPNTWTAIGGVNDTDGSLSSSRIDFVGDSSNPGVYFAGNSEYLFFRLRVDDGVVTLFSDTILILIDKDQNGAVDYAFKWDGQSQAQADHSLELGVPGTEATTWEDIRMDEIVGNAANKLAPPDIGLTNGDGYIWIVNEQTTTHFGTTTFVDFAIKWSYLSANTTLGKNQTWNIQLGSINNANEFNWVDTDVAGGVLP